MQHASRRPQPNNTVPSSDSSRRFTLSLTVSSLLGVLLNINLKKNPSLLKQMEQTMWEAIRSNPTCCFWQQSILRGWGLTGREWKRSVIANQLILDQEKKCYMMQIPQKAADSWLWLFCSGFCWKACISPTQDFTWHPKRKRGGNKQRQ